MAQIKVPGTKQAQWTKSKHLYSKHPITRLSSVELSRAQSSRQLAVSRLTEKSDKLHRENYRSSLKSLEITWPELQHKSLTVSDL